MPITFAVMTKVAKFWQIWLHCTRVCLYICGFVLITKIKGYWRLTTLIIQFLTYSSKPKHRAVEYVSYSKTCVGKQTRDFNFLAKYCYLSNSVGIKSSPNFSKRCSKAANEVSTLYGLFQNSPKLWEKVPNLVTLSLNFNGNPHQMLVIKIIYKAR